MLELSFENLSWEGATSYPPSSLWQVTIDYLLKVEYIKDIYMKVNRAILYKTIHVLTISQCSLKAVCWKT